MKIFPFTEHNESFCAFGCSIYFICHP